MNQSLDYLILNATIVDGSGSEPFIGSVGVADGKIVMIEQGVSTLRADKTIDATGLFLTPGFIDTHASTGYGLFFPHAADHKLYQGITTEIFGNCGTSPAPVGPQLKDNITETANNLGFKFDWHSLGEYFDRLEEVGLQFNVASLTGHGTLRWGYVDDWSDIKSGELIEMEKALDQSMKDGALGLSTGLIYAPGSFSDTSEVVKLAKIAQEDGGVYASHMRDERDKLEEAIEETLTIGEEARINVLVSHLKAAEKRNFGKISKVLSRLEEYNQSHSTQAKIDVYPYTAVSTRLQAFVPKDLLSEGLDKVPCKLRQPGIEDEVEKHIEMKGYDLDQMMFISNDYPQWEGKSIAEIAALEDWTLAGTLIELLVRDTELWIVYFCIDESDIDQAICWPNAMICTDSWSHPINAPKKIGIPHPRSYGAFTQYLYDYVKMKKLLSFHEAIRKITSMPAEYFNLHNRGRIEEGYIADLVLLNLENLKPNATYTDPMQLSDGVEWVWVNGQVIIKERAINDKKPGVIIRNQTKS